MLELNSVKSAGGNLYDFNDNGSAALLKQVFEELAEGLVKFPWEGTSGAGDNVSLVSANTLTIQCDQ